MVTNIENIDGGGFAGVRIVGTSGTDTIDLSGYTVTGIAAIDGGKSTDTIIGSAAADTIIGGEGADNLSGGNGDDTFIVIGSSGIDTIDGGAGNDAIVASESNFAIQWGTFSTVEVISGGGFDKVRIGGSSSGDTINLSGYTVTGIAAIEGGKGNDMITGSVAADTIIGGEGGDLLTGGAGADVFDFNLVTESRGSEIDRISDFGLGLDKIDLSSIDGNSGLLGNQVFSFIGTGVFTNLAGQLRADTTTISGVTRVLGDTDGNGLADLEIHLTGTLALAATDFVLGF